MNERIYPFEPIALPYSYDACEPFISEETIRTHYEKHYKGYVTKLNKCIENDAKLKCLPIERLAVSACETVRFYAGGVLNHERYFNGLYPRGRAYCTENTSFIISCFGGYDALADEYVKKAQSLQGSGYVNAVLGCGKISLKCTANQDFICGNVLLCCDMWEHAYYLDYRNDKEKYVRAWLRLALPK